MKSNFVMKGLEISCPTCHQVCYTVPYNHSRSTLYALLKSNVDAGEMPFSDCCNTPYFRRTPEGVLMIHVNGKGWQ